MQITSPPPAAEGEEPILVPIHIAVVLMDISAEVENKCGQHIEFWHTSERRVLGPGEALAANPPLVVSCLRLETPAKYNPEEDEFEAQTYYTHSKRRVRSAHHLISKRGSRSLIIDIFDSVRGAHPTLAAGVFAVLRPS